MRAVVIGSGIAGLTAAREIRRAGHAVTVLDKGRRAGGRLATRRLQNGASADYGAQFFTVRSEELGHELLGWLKEGLVREWCRGFSSEDGHPRYSVTGGMARLPAQLTDGLDVRQSTHVETVRSHERGWLVSWPAAHGSAGGSLETDVVVLTAPVAQSAALLGSEAKLPEVEYEPVIAQLLALDRPPSISGSGGLQLSEDPTWSWVADNVAKGASSMPAVTFHTRADVARARWDEDALTLSEGLLEAASPWLGDAQVLDAIVHRWRYSAPLEPLPERCLICGEGLIVAGDAFGGPRVEGAFLSGLAAGHAALAIET